MSATDTTMDDDGPPDDKKMPLLEHLVELRQRLFWSVATFFVCFLVAYYFAHDIFNFLVVPLHEVYKDKPDAHRMIYTAPTEAFFTYVKVAFFTAAFIAFPVIAGQIWMFVAPGLYKHEKQAFLPFLAATPVLFLLGASLLYYLILPMALGFFASFEVPAGTDQMQIQLEAKMSEYLSLVMTLIMAFGISFQLPVLLALLAKVGMISSEGLASKRRYAVVGVVAFAGMVTPPDVFSQVSLAIPLYLLYEVSIWVARMIEKQREDEERKADEAEKAKPKPKPKAAVVPAAAAPAAAGTAVVAFEETDFNQAR